MTNHFTREEAVALKKKIEDAIRLADNVGRSRGMNNYARNTTAVNKLVTLELEIRSMIDAAVEEIDSEHADVIRKLSYEVRVLYTHPQASEPAPSTAGERDKLIAELRRGIQPQHTTISRFMYAATLAADMLEQDAALLQSTALPATGMPKIGCVQHDCAECQARAALPVGELTDEQIIEIDEATPTDANGVHPPIDFARAILAAALLEAQPKLEPTDEQIGAAAEAWFGAEVEAKGFKTRMRLAIEAAQKIGGQG